MRLEKNSFGLTLKFGAEKIRVIINSEKALAEISNAFSKITSEDPDALKSAEIAADMLNEILGEENAKRLLFFYGGQSGELCERLFPPLMKKITRKAFRAEKKRQRERLKLYK